MYEIAFDLFCVVKQEYFLQISFVCSAYKMDEICPKWSYVNTHVYIFQDLVTIEIKLQF